IKVVVSSSAGNDDLDTRIKDCCVDGVVPPQRMANGAVVAGFHVWQGIEQVEAADVIPDSFHSAAGIAEGFEVRLIFGHCWVSGGEDDAAPLGKFMTIIAVVFPSQAHCYLCAQFPLRRL